MQFNNYFFLILPYLARHGKLGLCLDSAYMQEV